MNKIVLFFCDIQGTLIGNNINEENDYVIFRDNLSIMGDNVLFSLVSTETKEIVSHYLDILSNYFSNNIIIGRQYYENGYIYNNKSFEGVSGKCSQIIEYITELSKIYDIDKVYFADDNKFICEMVGKCINLVNSNIYYQAIVPSKLDGLKELNTLIKDKINNKEEKIIKFK